MDVRTQRDLTDGRTGGRCMTEKKGPAAHIDQAREAACSRLLPESRTLNQQTWKLGSLETWKLGNLLNMNLSHHHSPFKSQK